MIKSCWGHHTRQGGSPCKFDVNEDNITSLVFTTNAEIVARAHCKEIDTSNKEPCMALMAAGAMDLDMTDHCLQQHLLVFDRCYLIKLAESFLEVVILLVVAVLGQFEVARYADTLRHMAKGSLNSAFLDG